jgi:hypothetical protein
MKAVATCPLFPTGRVVPASLKFGAPQAYSVVFASRPDRGEASSATDARSHYAPAHSVPQRGPPVHFS